MPAHLPIDEVAADAPRNRLLVAVERVVVALGPADGKEMPPPVVEEQRVILDVFARRGVGAFGGAGHGERLSECG